MPRLSRVISQLKGIRSKPAPGGSLSIWSPRRKGSHGDIASALVLALHAASEANVGPLAQSVRLVGDHLDTYAANVDGRFNSGFGRGF